MIRTKYKRMYVLWLQQFQWDNFHGLDRERRDMDMKKRKAMAAGLAATLAAATLLGGTFAWQSVSQKATNETVREVNPGARLHDDFDGTNKDVYVENFTDPASGKPVFVRVRLDEYMESGSDAGINRLDESRDAVPLVKDSDINNPTTWSTHIPGDSDDPFHQYWTWATGGSTVFMPTFNKNKDSLASDINGTYEGKTPNDGITYDDYVTYQSGEKKTDTAYYDADKDNTDEGGGVGLGNGGQLNVNYNEKQEEHTAKNTRDATVLTMDEWMDMGSPVGNYWVWDVDGWAYWAAPVMPGEATGLLLSQINSTASSGDRWYYAINVVGQFADANGWGTQEDNTGFYDDTEGEPPTGDALELLKQAASVVVGENGEWYLPQGSNVYEKIDDDTGKSLGLVCAGMNETIGDDDDKSNVVKLEPEDETYGKWFLGPDSNGYYQSVGPDELLGTADDILVVSSTSGDADTTDNFVEALLIQPRIGTELGTELKAYPGDQVPFGGVSTQNGQVVEAAQVVWSVVVNNMATGTTIADGQLTIAADQAVGSTLTVTAQCDGKVGQVKITVTYGGLDYDDIHSVVPGATTKLSIDGYQWYVLVKDDVNSDDEVEALLYETDGAIPYTLDGGYETDEYEYLTWATSDAQIGPFKDFLNNLGLLQSKSVPVHLHSRNGILEWNESTDAIFPLTEADLFGTQDASPTTDVRDYTYTQYGVGQVLVPNQKMRTTTIEEQHILRNMRNAVIAGYVSSDGTLVTTAPKCCFRPAMWVTFSQSGT